MKLRIAFAFALSVFALAAHAEKIALINGTLINPGTSQVIQNATIVIGEAVRIVFDPITDEISMPRWARA